MDIGGTNIPVWKYQPLQFYIPLFNKTFRVVLKSVLEVKKTD